MKKLLWNRSALAVCLSAIMFATTATALWPGRVNALSLQGSCSYFDKNTQQWVFFPNFITTTELCNSKLGANLECQSACAELSNAVNMACACIENSPAAMRQQCIDEITTDYVMWVFNACVPRSIVNGDADSTWH